MKTAKPLVDTEMKVGLVSGFWGQNIGNAFFNLGGMYALSDAFGPASVKYIRDQPGYWTTNRSRRSHRHDWGLIENLDLDLIVLQGPVFSLAFRSVWERTLEKLYARGIMIAYLSCAFFQHKREEEEAVKRLLERYPPAFLSTRDTETYGKLKGICDLEYDGICSAWFCPDAYAPPRISNQKYVVFNFDRWTEPRCRVANDDDSESNSVISSAIGRLRIERNNILDRVSARGKATAYLAHLLDARRLPNEIEGRTIVRPEHRTNPYLSWKIYRRPNGFSADEPYSYLTVYANADLVLTDRVHGCLAALAYGSEAMLFTSSPRSRLFERFGIDVRNKICSLDAQILSKEKSGQLRFLNKAALSLSGNRNLVSAVPRPAVAS